MPAATTDAEAAMLPGFSDPVRQWFAGAFAAPTPAQSEAWASIASGGHTLVIAPTGSGKTLAAFLWAIDKLTAAPPPADPARRCRVLYISPLKALAVDIERNLRSPLTGVGQAMSRLGLPEPAVTVGVRTGDTAADQRRQLAAKPPDILITTPESLFLLLTSRARDGLRGVETVIVDEVHAMAGGKRGAHLAVSLERLDALRGAAGGDGGPVRPAQRIGLSATVRPPQEVAAFLGGAQPVTIVQPPSDKRLELTIVVPVEDMSDLEDSGDGAGATQQPAARGGALTGPAQIMAQSGVANPAPRAVDAYAGGQLAVPAATGDRSPDGQPAERRRNSIWPHVEAQVLDQIERHRSTIVFANSRRLAERLCARLNELAAERAAAGDPAGGEQADAPVVARAHHGSVSRAERSQIEEALKAGWLPAVVATSSLELGIDMGAVDLVIQVESPPSVASGLQRTGRAGHNVGDVSRGMFFPKYQADLVQTAVVARRMRAGQIEELRMPRTPLDVLAQQIVAMTAMDDWDVGGLEQLVRRAAPFSGLTRPVLEAVLDMLAGRYPSEDFAGLRPRLVWDRTEGTLRGRPGGQRIAVTNGGTIPDRGLFGVFLAGGGRERGGRHSRRVGELDEEMVYESRVGDVFVLGASSWRIEDITADQVLVSPAPGQPGRLPFWHGDTPGRPAELGRAVGAYCRELGAVSPGEAARRLLGDGLDALAARNLIRYLADQRQATGHLPDDRTLVLERFRDELGDWRLILHSPYGAKVHAPWALAIGARLRERYGGMDVQAMYTDDGIVIRVPDADDPPPGGFAILDPDEVEQLVTSELGGSALFASRFRECAARALLLPRRQPGRRSPLWQQRQRAAQLLAVASQYGSFPIVLETVRECLQDVFDVPALVALMRDLSARRIRLVDVETPAASPFARSLLFRYVGAFMYEGDAPLAERRAQALALDSALLAELLGQADLRELLDPRVIDECERELQRLAPARRCRGPEALRDMLADIGPLSADEIAERCLDRPAAAGWLADLAAQRRVIEVRVAGEQRWAVVEDAGRLRDALGVALPVGIPVAFTELVADPLGDLIARYGRSHGPFTALAAARRYGLGPAVVAGILRRLAASGRLAEGEFAAQLPGPQWCDAGVLRLLRRRCLARLRREVEPVPASSLAVFLPAWQHADRQAAEAGRATGHAGFTARPVARRPGGPDAVYDVIEQLAGVAVPASALESLILPGRVPGYSAADLDELTAAGEVVWAGAGALPGGDGWIALAPAAAAALVLPLPQQVTFTDVHQAVLDVLGGGALFFRALADLAARRLAGSGPAPGRAAAVPGAAMPAPADGAVTANGAGAPSATAGKVSDQLIATALWDLTWAGLLTNDTLAPLRAALGTRRPGGQRPAGFGGPAAGAPRWPASGPGRLPRRPSLSRMAMSSRAGPPTLSGRWSLLPAPEPDQTRRMHALAVTLLDRHGIVIRGAVAAEHVPGGFAALYPVLRAMEDSGQCRRGYFVEGLGAAQFALAGAVDRIRAMAEPAGREPPDLPPGPGDAERDSGTAAVVLAAADPASAYGAALPWPARPDETPGGHKPGRKAGALVVLVAGQLVLYVERGGKTLLSWTSDPRLLGPAAAALAGAVHAGALGRLAVERADGTDVRDSPLAAALEAAGFRSTPRGLRLRG